MRRMTLTQWNMPQPWRDMVALAQGSAPEPDCPWEQLRYLAVKNNLVIPVSRGVEGLGNPTLRQNPRLIELRLLARMQRSHGEKLGLALRELAEGFGTLPFLSLKGPLLAMELYGDPCARNSCDLDILVAPERVKEAVDALTAMGYRERTTPWDKTPKRKAWQERRQESMHRVFCRDGVTVELHWRLCYRYEASFESLWESRRVRTWQGSRVCVLGKQEELCYLITHAAGHGYRQLRWLLELWDYLQREDFPVSELYAAMNARGVGMLLLETLLLLYRLPGFPMPRELTIGEPEKPLLTFRRNAGKVTLTWEPELGKDIRQARRLVAAVLPLLRRSTPEEGLDGRYYRHLLPTLGKKRPWLLSLWEPITQELTWLDLPDRLFFLYFPLRPIHFIHALRKRRTKRP